MRLLGFVALIVAVLMILGGAYGYLHTHGDIAFFPLIGGGILLVYMLVNRWGEGDFV